MALETKRIKSRKKEFLRIRVDEQDLSAIARKIVRATKDQEGDINIKVETADKEDIFKTSNPDFFVGDEMPKEVGSVVISYFHINASIECRVSFGSNVERTTEVSVEGTAPEVAMLFRDLEMEMVSRRTLGESLVRASRKFWFVLLGCALGAAAAYSIFDLALDSWGAFHPNFKGSTSHNVIGSASWVIVITVFLTGAVWVQRVIKKCLPSIEFSGKISGGQSKGRKTIIAISSALLLSILARIFYDLIAGVLDFWSSMN